MVELDEYFEDSKEEAPHPKVRAWRKLIKEGKKAKCELHRKLDGLTYGLAKLYVSFYDETGAEIRRDEVEWEPEINEELLRLHVAAVNRENEGKRLGLMLKTWFARQENRYGDGFFSTILYEYIQNSPFSRQPPVREALQHIYEERPNRESRSYDDCVDSIEGV